MRETNQSRAASFVKAKFGRPMARGDVALLKCAAMRELKLGTLTARVTGGTDREGGGTGPVVVLLHGYGAPGTDLVPLWRELAVPQEVRFVFPEAPLELDFGGRAWWPIDMARLQERFSHSAVERLIAEVPPGLDSARSALLELLSVLERDFGALPEQTVLGGFSQGAMLATDTVLRTSRPFGGLALLSGTLICHDEWLPLLAARRGLPVLQSHGRADQVLPFELAERLRAELVSAGLPVEFVAFNGGHGIPGGVLEGLTRMIRRLTPERA
jgi:phospholipase/carboxylesterase